MPSPGGGARKDAAVQAAARALLSCIGIRQDHKYRSDPTITNQSLSAQEFDHSTGDGKTTPEACAGPKLLAHAIRNNWPRPYAMSEVWSAKRHDAASKFAKSEPIESCNTCCRLMPLMLCG